MFFQRANNDILLQKIVDNNLLNIEWYSLEYSLVGDNEYCLNHYRKIGFKNNYDPGPYFNHKFYLAKNPDLNNYKGSLIEHYVNYGINEGRISSQYSLDLNEIAIKQEIIASRMFDFEFYANNYSNKIPLGVDILDHYIKFGACMGYAPFADFDYNFYWGQNPNLFAQCSANSVTTFLDYIRNGHAKGALTIAPFGFYEIINEAINDLVDIEPSLSFLEIEKIKYNQRSVQEKGLQSLKELMLNLPKNIKKIYFGNSDINFDGYKIDIDNIKDLTPQLVRTVIEISCPKEAFIDLNPMNIECIKNYGRGLKNISKINLLHQYTAKDEMIKTYNIWFKYSDLCNLIIMDNANTAYEIIEKFLPKKLQNNRISIKKPGETL
ncbi:hypothetical protein [Pseudaquidulcibacter saccharophilus]|uniref:hypothetical protein n=1 Tax=Pseudaquidulcibacter saccharophilus TaxID=2831900 RepID=UPI001EFF169A|nr:hypothetical protein [Pseudaquidulcibacter saccharophilus]